MVTDTDITLKNGGDVTNVKRGLIKAEEVRQMTVKAIVDTGVANQTPTTLPMSPSDKALELIRLARTIVINEETRNKLGLLDSGIGEATRLLKELAMPMANIGKY